MSEENKTVVIKGVTISAGIVLIVDNKILLCHPTNHEWKNTFSIPKGMVDEGESIQDAALRECFEEVGLDLKKLIPEFDINKYESGIVDYVKKGKLVKQVHYYVVNTTLKELKLSSETLPKEMLQIEEVDWAGFLKKEEAKEKAFWRLHSVLDLLK